ncbi:MAG TPA: hypothetical protein VFY93_07950 [Planctomycetota bacterium]|nr:hypothetical protein [Planctomycetota bacterium]
MSRIVLLLLAAAAPAFAAGEGPTPLERDVEALLAGTPLVAMPRTEGGYLSAAASGGLLGTSLRLDVWLPALTGDLEDDAGNSASLSDLNVDGTEVVLVPRAFVSLGGVGFLVDAWRFQTEGDGTINDTFTFGGVDFVVSEDVHTDVDITNVRGLLTLPIVSTDFVKIALLGGISYYDFNVTVTGATSGSGSVSTPVPVPLAGVLGQAKLGPLLLEVEVSGLTFDYGDYNIDYLDVQASVGMTVFKILAVRAGYRLVHIDGTIEGYNVDGTLDGFFIGASLNF